MGVGQGTLVVVVGPSGVGKDSVIDFAKAHFSGNDAILFVRRVVTRTPDASAEDHDSLDPAAFDAAEAEGIFSFSWSAHGLRYGLPRGLDIHIEKGGVAIANGSRATLDRLAARYPSLVVVHLTVSRDVLAKRLAARGREAPDEIAARLSRAEELCDVKFDWIEIRNDGPIEQAGGTFVDIVERQLAVASLSA